MAPVLEVTLDSAPTSRSILFRNLLKAGGILRTSGVEDVLRCSKPTALKQMQVLKWLGVVEKSEAVPESGRPEQEIRLVERFNWFLSPEFKTLNWPEFQTQSGFL